MIQIVCDVIQGKLKAISCPFPFASDGQIKRFCFLIRVGQSSSPPSNTFQNLFSLLEGGLLGIFNCRPKSTVDVKKWKRKIYFLKKDSEIETIGNFKKKKRRDVKKSGNQVNDRLIWIALSDGQQRDREPWRRVYFTEQVTLPCFFSQKNKDGDDDVESE